MAKVLVNKDLLLELGNLMKKQAEELAQARDQIAELEQARDEVDGQVKIAHDVLDLIREGLVDPLDGHAKLAEFQERPELASLIKEASKLNVGAELLGSVSDDQISNANASPDDALLSNIRDIINSN